jgi:undecaprenyl-diphosphatase
VTTRRNHILLAVAAALVLVATALLATQALQPWERHLFETINGSNRAVAAALWLPMQLGNAFAPIVVAVAWYLVCHTRRVALGVFVAGEAAWLIAPIIKDWVGRPRPASLIPDTIIHVGGTAQGLGFPSGHAAVAFAIATVLAAAVRFRGRVIVYALAGLVAYARVYVGAHLPLDVIGGAALGVLLGSLWNAAAAQ